jgi:hypothetical protein
MQSKAGPLVGYERVLIIVVYDMNRRGFLSQGTEIVETCQVVFRKGWGKRNVNEGEKKGKSRKEEEGLMGRREGKRKECPWKKQLKEAVTSHSTENLAMAFFRKEPLLFLQGIEQKIS